MNSSDDSVVLPMWRGRRGVINTIFVSVIGVAAAVAFWFFAVTVVIRPACTELGEQRGLTFVDYKVYTRQQKASSACVFKSRSGATQDVYLTEATSFVTDLWVAFALSPMITVPAFIVLFAVTWTRLTNDGRRRGKA